MPLISILNLAIALGSLALAVVTIILCVDFFIYKGRHFSGLVTKFAWPIIITVTTLSVFMSLVYSEYFGFIPCSLCWLQRIAIYPQALLSIIGFRLNDRVFFPIYGIALSVFGLVVAIYHYIYQMFPAESSSGGVLPCLADGSNADCATKVIDLFGFVTFPLISAITFAFLIMIYLYQLRTNR